MNQENESIELTVIAPVYNEELIVADSVRRLREALEDLPIRWELILVDDGSTDQTGIRLREATGDDPRIRVISYRPNRGRGYALRRGFDSSRGRYVVTTEADLNYGQDIIERLYNALLESEADLVIASPYRPGGRLENVPWRRALLSRLGNRLLRLAVPARITTLSGMVRGYRGSLIRSLPLREDGKEIHLEIVSKSCILGSRITEIPAVLRWKPKQKGAPQRKSKFRAGRLIASHLLFGFFEAPILLFGSLGLVSLALGTALGCYLSFLYFVRDQVIGDRVVLILTTIFLILAGFAMFLFCFVSYQIKEIKKDLFILQHTLRQRPRDPDANP
ncbi:MAG: glycosyltransferase family 2 protein [Sedimentisphaerales bacterium]|nr:glycosyltransferase family 2 protein [Sedimentisphaerales bacterium]